MGNLRPDAFAGTAAAYLRYRPPYPSALLSDLLARAEPPESPTLLDLGSGPGRIALDLAPAFRRTWAVDLEAEMVGAGREEAARRGITNLTWLVARAEDAPIAPGSVDLITIGEAFHRLDQDRTVQNALAWLKPGGCIATLGTGGILAGGQPWKDAVAQVARRWMARAFPEGRAEGRPGAALLPNAVERLFRDAGFIDVESRVFTDERDWSFEEILGYLRSTSVCSERALGGDFAGLAAELAAALGVQPGQVFRETRTCGYTLGRKPKTTTA